MVESWYAAENGCGLVKVNLNEFKTQKIYTVY